MKATTNPKFLAAMFAGSMLSLAATYVQAATINLTPAGLLAEPMNQAAKQALKDWQ